MAIARQHKPAQVTGHRIPLVPILRSALERLWSDADGVAKHLVAVTLLLVLSSSVVAGLVPLLLKLVIDELEGKDSRSAYVFIFFIVVYALSHWLTKSLRELRGMFYGRADYRVQRQLSSTLFQHVMSLPLRFHLDRNTGALSQTLVNGLLGYRMILYHLLLTVLPVVTELATMSTVLLALDHAVFLAIISVSVLLYTLAFWLAVARIAGPARAVSNAHIDANSVLTDSILNYETIKHFCAEEEVHGRFGAALARIEIQWAKLFRRKMENGIVLATIFTLSLGVSVYVAARAVQQGTMTVGEFVLVNAYILQIAQPLEMVGFAFRDIAQGMGFIEKLAELFGQECEVDVIGNRASAPKGPPKLVFEQVSFSYPHGQRVINDVDLVVPSGKTIAIVGASGSGKSSLVRLLVRLVEPTEGQIRLNDVPLSNIPMATLRNTIAVVPQHIALFDESIAYNIGLGRQGSTESEIVRAAKIACIHDFIAGLPDGYATMVGERGIKLSGGEKQRVAIARAALKQPTVFVFDEATASLDSKMERAILHNLIKVASRATTLIIAHRLSTIVHADEIVVLDHGSIVERGTHAELLRGRGAYAAMWNVQQQQREERISAG